MNLGERIAEIRKSKGVSQTFITNKLSKTSGWLSNIENGRRDIRAEELNKIAKILGVEVGIFFNQEINASFNERPITTPASSDK